MEENLVTILNEMAEYLSIQIFPKEHSWGCAKQQLDKPTSMHKKCKI